MRLKSKTTRIYMIMKDDFVVVCISIFFFTFSGAVMKGANEQNKKIAAAIPKS